MGLENLLRKILPSAYSHFFRRRSIIFLWRSERLCASMSTYIRSFILRADEESLPEIYGIPEDSVD